MPFFLLYPAGKYKNENGVHHRSLRTQRYTKPINTLQKPSKGRCASLEEGKEMAKEPEIWLDLLRWGGKDGWEVRGTRVWAQGLPSPFLTPKICPFATIQCGSLKTWPAPALEMVENRAVARVNAEKEGQRSVLRWGRQSVSNRENLEVISGG